MKRVAFAELLQTLLAGLDDASKQVVLLRVENHQYQEIADELDCSEKTVQRKMKMIRERLREILESEG
jgi:RNA polymerase sigma factor (sigma-70 family)